MSISKQMLHDTIMGKLVWKKCPQCEGSAWENWDENGEDVKGGHSENPERCNGVCENCDGIGFVEAYHN